MSYFVRSSEHRWGFDEYSLVDAFANAKLIQRTLLDTQLGFLEEALAYPDPSNKPKVALQKAQSYFKRSQTEDEDSESVEINIIFVDEDQWKFAGIDEVTGSPNYEYIGGEDEQPKFNPARFDGVFYPITGKIVVAV